MPDFPRLEAAAGWQGEPLRLLPVPLEVSIRQLNPRRRWRVTLANGLDVENTPPWRVILLGQRTVAHYPAEDRLQERLALVQLVAQGWMPATAWAAAFGLHRNSLGNWAWRYHYFGLDGLQDRPSIQQLQAVVAAAQELVQAPTRPVLVAALRQELEQRGLPLLPPNALRCLLWRLSTPPSDPPPGGDHRPHPQPIAPDAAADGQRIDAPRDERPPLQAEADAPAGPAPTGAVLCAGASSGEPAPQCASEAPRAEAAVVPEVAPVPEPEAAAPLAPPSALVPCGPDTEAQPMRYAGLALALPWVQSLLDPLVPFLERVWGGGRPWLYRPHTLLTAFMLYVISGFKNPEQVKAAPHLDFGPLLGRRRGPACITLRRRLVPMACIPSVVDAFQRELALMYLSLGWVRPGPWLVDGHFIPYFGEHKWGKGWWPQRRLAVRGAFQDWVADHRGRPLWLHLAQGFELFADHLPLIAQGLLSLLADAGADTQIVLIFDRGGYSAAVFTALNRLGVGWVTWIKAKLALAATLFTEQGTLPPGARHPDQPRRTVHYAQTTYAAAGLPPQSAVVWYEGDPAKQVGLISNLDTRYPGRYTALDQIRMLASRWGQENGFKDMVRHCDLDWSNGYAHEPSAQTPVPHPEVRTLRAKQVELTGKLRRAMNRAEAARSPRAAAHARRQAGAFKGLLTRLEHRLAQLPATIPYGALDRPATEQLQHGRGLLVPVVRAATHHIHLQMRDALADIYPDPREWDKVLRTILQTPGRYVPGPAADRVILEPCGQPRFIRALALLVARTNANPPHAPSRPDHPLLFELAPSAPDPVRLHNAPAASPVK